MERPTTEELLTEAKLLRLTLTDASARLSVFTQLLRDIIDQLDDEEDENDGR